MSALRDAAQQALEALEKEPADSADWIRTMKAARAALRTALAEQPAEQEPIAPAMATVIAAMQADPEYAWSWHCNIAMAFVDAGGDYYTANQGAARFMKLLANVEPAYDLPAAPHPAKPVEQEPVAWCDQYEGHIDGLRHYSDGGSREMPLYLAPQPRRNVTYVCPCCHFSLERQE